jgi:hypothetical protein
MYAELHYATLAILAGIVSYFSYVWGWNDCIDYHTEEAEGFDEEE